jgi:hypothetical protein
MVETNGGIKRDNASIDGNGQLGIGVRDSGDSTGHFGGRRWQLPGFWSPFSDPKTGELGRTPQHQPPNVQLAKLWRRRWQYV